jgi:hypothetical protein
MQSSSSASGSPDHSKGALLGVAQVRVLERDAPAIDGQAWVVATAAAAGFAWFVGMGGSALAGSDIAPAGVLLGVLAPAWATALLSMGYAQWLVLRRAVPRSGRWIWVTSGAWLLGVTIPVVALSASPTAGPAGLTRSSAFLPPSPWVSPSARSPVEPWSACSPLDDRRHASTRSRSNHFRLEGVSAGETRPG